MPKGVEHSLGSWFDRDRIGVVVVSVCVLLSVVLLFLANSIHQTSETAAAAAPREATRTASMAAAAIASFAGGHLVGGDLDGLKKAAGEAASAYSIRHLHIVDESGKEIYSTQSAFAPDDATKQLLDGRSPAKPYVSTVKTAAGPVVTATAAVVGGRAGYVTVGEPVEPSPAGWPLVLALTGASAGLVAGGFAAQRSLRGGSAAGSSLVLDTEEEPIQEAEIVPADPGALRGFDESAPMRGGDPLGVAFQTLWRRLALAVEKIRSVENDLSRTIFEVVETADTLKRSVREQDARAGAAVAAFRAVEGAATRQKAIAEGAGRAVEDVVSSAYAIEAHLDSTIDEAKVIGKSALDASECVSQIAKRGEAARTGSRTLDTIATQLNMIALRQAANAANTRDGAGGASWDNAAIEDMQQLAVCAGEASNNLAEQASFLSSRVEMLRDTLTDRIGGGASLVETRIERAKESCDSAAVRLNQVVASLGELVALSKEATTAGEAAAQAVMGLAIVVSPSVDRVSQAALTAKETTERTGRLLDDMRMNGVRFGMGSDSSEGTGLTLRPVVGA